MVHGLSPQGRPVIKTLQIEFTAGPPSKGGRWLNHRPQYPRGRRIRGGKGGSASRTAQRVGEGMPWPTLTPEGRDGVTRAAGFPAPRAAEGRPQERSESETQPEGWRSLMTAPRYRSPALPSTAEAADQPGRPHD